MVKQNKTLDEELDEFAQQPIRDIGETEGAIKAFLEDEEDPRTGRSNIDQKTILHEDQVSTLSVTEIMGELGVIPDAKSFTSKLKRHAISVNGIGRQQVVQLSTGIMQQQSGVGWMERVGNLFKSKRDPGL